MILIDAERQSDWLVMAINRRLRAEFAKLHVAINEDKSRMVNLKKGESFTFLDFQFRRILSFQRKWRPHYAPKLSTRQCSARDFLGLRCRDRFRNSPNIPRPSYWDRKE